MSELLTREIGLVYIVLLVITPIIFLVLRNSKLTKTERLEKIILGLLGSFLVMSGIIKSFEPFSSMYDSQILAINIPNCNCDLVKTMGQYGEILSGVLFLIIFFGEKLKDSIKCKILAISSFLITIIMIVAIYVHFSPNVLEECLPLRSKVPVICFMIIITLLIIIKLHSINQKKKNS